MRTSKEFNFALVQTEAGLYEDMVRRALPYMRPKADRLSGGDYALADECIQQTLLEAASEKAWAVLRYLAPRQQQKWMNTTMSHKIIDELRRRKQNRAKAVTMLPEAGFDRTEQPPDDLALALDRLDQQHAYRLAVQALTDVLATDHKGPFTVLLLGLADYTDEEIADVMGVKKGTVRAHRHRGHKIMEKKCGSLQVAWNKSLRT